MSGRAAALLSLAAGALLPLAFAPFGFWPLTILCPALLLACWQSGTPRALAWRGWLFGLGLFGTGSSWVYVSIHTYGDASVTLAALLTALFCAGLALFMALQGWLYAHLRQQPQRDALLLFPALWLLSEWLRGWLLTGFPWLYLGTPHVDTWLGGWAPWLGVLSMGALCCLMAGLCVNTVQQPRLIVRNGLAIALVFASGWALQGICWVQPQAPVTVALVQANIPQHLKWDASFRETTLAQYRSLSKPYWGTDLVVWPEAALPVFLDNAETWLAAIEQQARGSGTTLITGIPIRTRQADGKMHYFNSVIAIGNGLGTYEKHKLVPFGEYVPLEHWLRGLIAFFDLPMSSFTAGPAHQPPLQAGSWAVAPLICYEIAYPDYTAHKAQPANLIVTVSNDTWFGASIGPDQHLQIARIRALETGRAVIRATNNGITALIDHHGKMIRQLPQFTQAVLTGTVQPTTGQTLFDIWGSWPVVILAITWLGIRQPSRHDP